MKLLSEIQSFDSLEFLTEENNGEKTYKIRGPFLQSEVENRNGREYSKELCEREVGRFQEKIKMKRALGELDHPPSPTVNLQNVSHLINSLKMQGNDGIGEAILLDTITGNLAKSLLKAGVQLGVSTRGVGTLNGKHVNEDYRLITVDIVADPSAPNAYVDGILENKDYIITEGGDIVEKAIEKLEEKLDKKGLSGDVYSFLQDFLADIRSKM